MNNLGPALLRLILDADDESWQLAGELVDTANLHQARQAAWDAALFMTTLLLRLRNEHPDLIDVDAIVAEWGLKLAAEALP